MTDSTGIVVGVDASRNRSGGAIRHLVGILGVGDPRSHGIRRVHVWSYDKLLGSLPDAPWLVKHCPPALSGSIARQAWWQRRHLPAELRANGVDIVLYTDAGTVGRAHPSVTMSRDMTQYEPGEMNRYRLMSRPWIRNVALRLIQVQSLRDADGVIFLTHYASKTIQGYTGALSRVAIVPHGVDRAFRQEARNGVAVSSPVRCVYVSPADMYKHQWHVVRAIADLRSRGHDLTLTLVGGGQGPAQHLIEEERRRSDPNGEFVKEHGFVRGTDLPGVLAEFDIFVFASSCENMPNTLVEGMASGLPIVCSDRGPMPEVLRDGGLYFDPENPTSIAAAIEKLLVNPSLRAQLAKRAAELSRDFSWERCARETWAFLRETRSAVVQDT